MNYLLDTCVLSEFTKRSRNPHVVRWMAEADEETLFICAISIAEISSGIERLEESPRKIELGSWFDNELLMRFAERVLAIDVSVALAWGKLAPRLNKQGRKMPAADSLIAAAAIRHGLVLVTRNVADFEFTGLKIINPW